MDPQARTHSTMRASHVLMSFFEEQGSATLVVLTALLHHAPVCAYCVSVNPLYMIMDLRGLSMSPCPAQAGFSEGSPREVSPPSSCDPLQPQDIYASAKLVEAACIIAC